MEHVLMLYECLQANFFITYIMTTGWAGMPLEILQSGSLVLNFLKRNTVEKKKPLLDSVFSLPYFRTLPTVLFFVLLGLVYSIINRSFFRFCSSTSSWATSSSAIR